MLHLFSFGFFSGEFRADLLRLLFSILQWCREVIIDSKQLANHSKLPLSFYSLLLSLAAPFFLVFFSFYIFLLSRSPAQLFLIFFLN